jgi:hypothetical protein
VQERDLAARLDADATARDRLREAATARLGAVQMPLTSV